MGKAKQRFLYRVHQIQEDPSGNLAAKFGVAKMLAGVNGDTEFSLDEAVSRYEVIHEYGSREEAKKHNSAPYTCTCPSYRQPCKHVYMVKAFQLAIKNDPRKRSAKEAMGIYDADTQSIKMVWASH